MRLRPEARWLAGGVAVLVAITALAPVFASWAAPAYGAGARLLATGEPWQIGAVEVATVPGRPDRVLCLTARVQRSDDQPEPSAQVTGRVALGAVAEVPAVYWALLIAWPAQRRRVRVLRLLCGVPVYLALELATTVLGLVHALPEASAILAGNPDPLTGWERWTRFLEAGGRFALILAAALATLALAERWFAARPATAAPGAGAPGDLS